MSSVCPPRAIAITRGEGQRQAFDLDRLRAQRDVVVGAFAQHDRADVHSGARREADLGHLRVIVERITRSVGGGLEQQEQAVGAVDLAAVVLAKQIARPPVVLGPQGSSALVAQPLRGRRAVDDIGEQQGSVGGHRGFLASADSGVLDGVTAMLSARLQHPERAFEHLVPEAA